MTSKRLKMCKKALCLIFAFLFSINCFAAVVSDNDGSAFITKAEFDSLKNNFQTQLDAYNSSIDNKIDNAISSYLAGIKTELTTTKNIINSNWEEVSALNGVLLNTYKVPSVTLDFFLNSRMRQNDNGNYNDNNFFYLVAHYSHAQYNETWTSTTNCYRNLVKTTREYPTVGDIIWDGQAVRYHEKYNIARLVYHYVPNRISATVDTGLYMDWPFLDRPATSEYRITMRNFTTITTSGYVSNWDTIKASAWPIGYLYNYTTEIGGAWNTRESTIYSSAMNDSFVTEVSLDADNEGKTKRYEHIIAYNKEDEWRLTNPEWNMLLNPSPESSVTASNLMDAATISGECRVMGVAHHANPHQGGRKTAAILQEITNDATIPSLGLFAAKRKASVIYQDNEKYNIKTDTKTIEKIKPTLPQGFQLLAADKDTTIEWEPEFNYTHVHNGTDTYTDNNHEVDIYFSSVPFTDKTTTTKKIQVKYGTSNDKKDYATTTNRKVKIKFDMPEDGIVYVKWVPHNETTYLDNDWIITLDVSKCNTYKATRKQ